MDVCPSDLALDDLNLHGEPAGGPIAAHVSGCPRCTRRMGEREALEREFHDTFAPAVRQAVAREVGRARWRPRLLVAGGTFAAVAAMICLAVFRMDGRYVGSKGGEPVEIVVRRGDAIFALATDAIVPGDELRFRPRAPATARFVALGSVDGAGRYAPFYPATLQGTSVPLPAAGEPLPGAITVDDAPGPERVLVVYSERPLAVSDVASAAERAAATLAPIPRVAEVPVHGTWRVLRKAAERRTP